MVSIKYKCSYPDAVWVCVHSSWIVAQQMWPLLREANPSSRPREGPISKHRNGLGTNKKLVVGPNEVRNHEWLRWRGPAAIYSYAMLCRLQMLISCYGLRDGSIIESNLHVTIHSDNKNVYTPLRRHFIWLSAIRWGSFGIHVTSTIFWENITLKHRALHFGSTLWCSPYVTCIKLCVYFLGGPSVYFSLLFSFFQSSHRYSNF
jgi:hypothetical protein